MLAVPRSGEVLAALDCLDVPDTAADDQRADGLLGQRRAIGD